MRFSPDKSGCEFFLNRHCHCPEDTAEPAALYKVDIPNRRDPVKPTYELTFGDEPEERMEFDNDIIAFKPFDAVVRIAFNCQKGMTVVESPENRHVGRNETRLDVSRSVAIAD